MFCTVYYSKERKDIEMSHFYGDLQGNRGSTTRCGTKEGGLTAHVRGWDVGVRVECRYDEKLGRDVISVYQTSGSNGKHGDIFAAQFTGPQESAKK